MPEKATVSIQEAAKLLGITSREQLYRMIKSGCLPIADGEGTKESPYKLVREGLEAAWANRRQQRVRSASTEKGREAKAKAREYRTGGPPLNANLSGDVLPDLDGLPPQPRGIPTLEDERAWVEYEKRYKLRMENLTEAKLLVYKADYDKSNMMVHAQVKQRIERIPHLLRTRIPGLDYHIFETVELLVREAMEGIANHNYAEENNLKLPEQN